MTEDQKKLIDLSTRVNLAIEVMMLRDEEPGSRRVLATVFGQCAVHQCIRAGTTIEQFDEFLRFLRAGFVLALQAKADEDKQAPN